MSQEFISKHDWLSLVSISGLIISEPVIESEFPKGFSPIADWKYMKFKKERIRFEINNKNSSNAMRIWLDFILEDQLEIEPKFWKKHNDIPKEMIIDLIEYEQTLRPNRVLINEESKPILLVVTYPTEQQLDKQENKMGRWKASPFVKIDRLLRETGIPLGLVTNGNDFMLVYAASGLSTSYITWAAQGWYDEKITIESFINLLERKRIFGNQVKKLLDLIEESQKRQADVANQLGTQIKDAIEIFIRALDKADKATKNKLLVNLSGDELYHITLTVMMRFVFLLYAEENFLLPHGQIMYDKSYGISYILIKLQEESRRDDLTLENNFNTWQRILATVRLVHGGCTHPDLLVTGYGGDLFNPKKFPILEHKDFRISNFDIYHILRRLTFTHGKIGKIKLNQRVSYRSLDIEQIGSIYENLFDYTVKRAESFLLVLESKDGNIIKLDEIENLSEKKQIESLSQLTGKPKLKIETIFENNEEKSAFLEKISELVNDTINQGDLYLTQKKGERKGSGSFYTPKDVTSFLVKKVLENLVYDKVDSKSIIKSPKEILDLKICDPAMGSGAFLVQVCRYLAERLVESWDIRMAKSSVKTHTCPFAEPSKGRIDELHIPDDRESALVLAKRFVAERCLYGVDLNPLSAELAKMSIWLTTMEKNKPFSFLDHHLKSGNSLISCHSSLIQKYPYDSWNRSILNDDDKIFSEKQKQIKLQKKNIEKDQHFLFNIDDTINPLIENAISKLEDIEKIPIFESTKKEKMYFDYLQSSDLKNIKNMFDAWSSLWFWETDSSNIKKVPMVDSYFNYLNCIKHNNKDSDIEQSWKQSIKEISSKNKFFQWEIEFPRVFFRKNPGFDVIVGNPPWDKIKFEEREFFMKFDSNYKNKTESEKNQFKDNLLSNPHIVDLFNEEKYFSTCMSNFVDSKLLFEFQTAKLFDREQSGDKNTYKLFLEKFFKLTRDNGYFGIVLPASLSTDASNFGLRKMLLEYATPLGFWSFYERAHIFPIDQVTGIFSFKKANNLDKFVSIDNIGFNHPGNIPEILLELEQRSNISPKIDTDTLIQFSPNTLIFQCFNTDEDFEILESIFKHPTLREKLSDGWDIETGNEIHMTADKKWFRSTDTGILLWRGENMGKFRITMPPSEWIDQDCPALKPNHNMFSRLTWRYVTSHHNIHRLVFTILPPNGGLGNSLSYFKPIPDVTLSLYLCGILNSFVLEYRARQTAQGPAITHSILKELPVPRLEKNNPIRIEIIKRVMSLIGDVFGKHDVVPQNLAAIKQEKDLARRNIIIAEIEALSALAFNLPKHVFENLLLRIPLPRGFELNWIQREKRHLALKKYDEFKELIQTV